MTLLDVSITNVALPSIGGSTDASPSQLQWIVSGYTLAFGLVPVLAGRLGDDHGRRRVRRDERALRPRPERQRADRCAGAPGALWRADQPAGLGPGAADVRRA